MLYHGLLAVNRRTKETLHLVLLSQICAANAVYPLFENYAFMKIGPHNQPFMVELKIFNSYLFIVSMI